MTSENNGMIMPVTPYYGGNGYGNDGMFGGNSYADGYSQGYSEGMRQSYENRGMSGHWPPMPYPERYRY